MNRKPRALRVAVGAARRLSARIRPVLHRSGPAQALQGALLQRIDVSDYNAAGPPDLQHVVSQTVTAAQILSPKYASWAKVLGEEPRFHRKQWEYVIVLEAADQAGVLREGCAAIGFGVGTEPLPAALASRGVAVLATDQAADNAGHWTRRGEHSSDVEALQKPDICPPGRFRRLVSFRPVDMNAMPAGLGSYDLVWSSCVIEHLGTPDAGLDFVRRSLDLLHPGGVAVHTTEFDLTPGPETVDYGHCAVYRRQDVEKLRCEVVAAGFQMTINSYVAFEHPADRYVAPPLSVGDEEFHLKLALYDSITTSFAIVVRRPTSD